MACAEAVSAWVRAVKQCNASAAPGMPSSSPLLLPPLLGSRRYSVAARAILPANASPLTNGAPAAHAAAKRSRTLSPAGNTRWSLFHSSTAARLAASNALSVMRNKKSNRFKSVGVVNASLLYTTKISVHWMAGSSVCATNAALFFLSRRNASKAFKGLGVAAKSMHCKSTTCNGAVGLALAISRVAACWKLLNTASTVFVK
jgi:hypothetical protein